MTIMHLGGHRGRRPFGGGSHWRWLALAYGAVAHGAAMHLKIYPVIYMPALMVFFREESVAQRHERSAGFYLYQEICRFMTPEAIGW